MMVCHLGNSHRRYEDNFNELVRQQIKNKCEKGI